MFLRLSLVSQFVVACSVLFSVAGTASPPGFDYEVITDEVPNARQIVESSGGIVYVGTRRLGKVYAVVIDDEFQVQEVVTVDEGLTMPSGVTMLGNDLIVAALNRVLRYRDIDTNFHLDPEPELITEDLPRDGWHGWKYLTVGTDGFLYVPVGAPCNVCTRDDERYASILRMDPETGQTTVYAHGIRNSVGMDWHPATNELWFSDNGRDMMGDDIPPEEINVVKESGQHFGFPYVHAGTILDDEFGQDVDPTDFEAPVVIIQAHAAAIGIDFYTHTAFPIEYHNALFIAEHGSWNRTSKVGYRVSVVKFSENGMEYEPFIDDWLEGENVSGRPSDVLTASDGSLLISDDYRGVIYRVTYKEVAD